MTDPRAPAESAHGNGRGYRPVHALVGALLALLLIRVFHFAAAPAVPALFSLFLAYTACVYFGAALAVGREARTVALELGLSLVFFALAAAGLFGSPLWVAAGYGLHGLWDIAHHPRSRLAAPVVSWFPPVCAVLDWVVAGFLLWRASGG